MLSRAKPEGGVEHRTHNESRVLIKRDGQWQVVHVHKSPAWQRRLSRSITVLSNHLKPDTIRAPAEPSGGFAYFEVTP